eukprot:776972_1
MALKSTVSDHVLPNGTLCDVFQITNLDTVGFRLYSSKLSSVEVQKRVSTSTDNIMFVNDSLLGVRVWVFGLAGIPAILADDFLTETSHSLLKDAPLSIVHQAEKALCLSMQLFMERFLSSHKASLSLCFFVDDRFLLCSCKRTDEINHKGTLYSTTSCFPGLLNKARQSSLRLSTNTKDIVSSSRSPGLKHTSSSKSSPHQNAPTSVKSRKRTFLSATAVDLKQTDTEGYRLKKIVRKIDTTPRPVHKYTFASYFTLPFSIPCCEVPKECSNLVTQTIFYKASQSKR